VPFTLLEDILNHNKSAEAKNAALIENLLRFDENSGCEFLYVKTTKTNLVRQWLPNSTLAKTKRIP
jgi:hypothetical protein